MKRTSFCTLLILALLGLPAVAHAQDDDTDPVTYLRLCSLYGAGFYYIPTTGMCYNPTTGDSREQTAAGTFRTFIHPPEGAFTKNLNAECAPGRVVNLGTFKSTDFTLNPLPSLIPAQEGDPTGYVYDRKHTVPLKLTLKTNEFVSQVAMSGGFYDPRTASNRSGTNMEAGPCRFDEATNSYPCSATFKEPGICLFSFDTVLFKQGDSQAFAPYANLPIGCIANSKLRMMPAPYVISATAAHPRVYSNFNDAAQTDLVTFVYGTDVLLSTNVGGGETLLTYHDATDGLDKPLAGSVSLSVCVLTGISDGNVH